VCGGSGIDATTACCSNTGAGLNGEVADCAGVCGGDTVDDACGTCGGNITNATECECDDEDVVRDCAGDCGGLLVDDCAGVCEGSAEEDCAGVCNGPSVINTAGDGECCAIGAIDCANICDGSAVDDACGVCSGSGVDATTGCCADGLGPNDEVQDCAGACGGSAVNDNCNVCGGDNSSCVNYSTEIQPLFSSCTGCHGSSGGLSLSSYNSLMTGGNSGAVVIPEDGSGSLLVKKLRGTAGTQMPKNQTPLNDTTINLIETWINEGALDN